MSENFIKLDNRLKLCADFVRKGSVFADIGTDHAYLPVWLCENGIISKAIAVDINELPLKSGRNTIIKHNLENCIDTRLSDGLSNISENEVDDIVIAGMGGELIADILENAKWIKNKKYHLILQPMTKAEILRDYLYKNGFTIQEEKCTLADKKLYTVMSVYFSGKSEKISDIKKYYGEINPKNSEYDYQYIVKVANSLNKKGNGMLSADPYHADGKKYLTYADFLFAYAEKGTVLKVTTVTDIYHFIDSFAPFHTALDFDNVGILIGDKNAVVEKVLIALDVNEEVVYEAQRINADLIITHHPVIFRPIKSLPSNSLPYMLAQRNLAVISAHTNLDLSREGVNTCLADRLQLDDVMLTEEGIAVGNIRNDCHFNSEKFATFVKEQLGCKGVRYTDIKKEIKRVAVGGGACGEYIYLAKELGADAFVTGEIKHNFIVESHSINLTVVDAGHYKTEDVVIDFLVDKLSKNFTDVTFIKSKTFTDYIDYV